MIKRIALTSVLVFCFAFPVAAGPSKAEMALLKKCIEAHTNLSKVSREAAKVLLEARKGGDANVKQYRGLVKAVNKWSDAVPARCKDMDDLLAGLKDSGDSKAAIMKCYKSYEKKEDACIKTAEKKIKKQLNDQKGQIKTIAKMNACVSKSAKPLMSCIKKNTKGNKSAISEFNGKLEKISGQYEKCWSDCAYKNSKKSDMIDICDKKCQKKSDQDEVAAIKGLIRELSQ